MLKESGRLGSLKSPGGLTTSSVGLGYERSPMIVSKGSLKKTNAASSQVLGPVMNRSKS